MEQIELLDGDGWKESPLFNEKERAAIRWSDEVSGLTASENDFAFEEMEKYFNRRQIVELTFICGMWHLSGRLAEALHLVVEPPGGRIAFQEKDI
ncbi:MAG TPA: hypothetical protein DDZ83_16670 [Nitrospinae bacterium]|nr:hypothetical protein [Nitrospinota bacterium]